MSLVFLRPAVHALFVTCTCLADRRANSTQKSQRKHRRAFSTSSLYHDFSEFSVRVYGAHDVDMCVVDKLRAATIVDNSIFGDPQVFNHLLYCQ